jgi:hypothetical protein
MMEPAETTARRGREARKAWALEATFCREIDELVLMRYGHRGRHLSYQRGKRNTNPSTSLIQIEGVENTEAAKYVGRLVFKMGKY